MRIRDKSIALMLALAATIQAADPANPFAASLAERAEAKSSLEAKIATFEATIQSEEKAGRIEPEDAKKERARISEFRRLAAGLMAPSPMFSRSALSTNRPANEMLGKAWDECVSSSTALDQIDLKLTKDVTAYATAVWSAASKPSDLAAAIDPIENVVLQIEDSGARRAGNFPASKLPGFLRSSQRFLEAIEIGNAEIAEGAWREITGAGQQPFAGPRGITGAGQLFAGTEMLPLSEIERWRVRFEGGIRDELKAVNSSVSEALVRKAPAADVLKLADTIDALNAKLRAVLTTNLRSTGRQPFNPENIARKVSAVLISAERGDTTATDQAVSGLSQTTEALTPAALTAAHEVRAAVVNRKRVAEQEKAAAFEKKLRERLAEITDAKTAIAFADQLRVEISAIEGGREASPLAALEGDLRLLTLLWEEENAALFKNDFIGQQSRNHPWGNEIKELRKKAFRAAVSRSAGVPEILRPPLDNLALDTAMRKLAKEAFKRQEWRRLYDLLITSANFSREVRPFEYDEELRAVKGLIIGENLERAEQFTDAILSYRAALNCVGELVPVDAVAARLKTLKKEHSDAFPKELPPSDRIPRKEAAVK